MKINVFKKVTLSHARDFIPQISDHLNLIMSGSSVVIIDINLIWQTSNPSFTCNAQYA